MTVAFVLSGGGSLGAVQVGMLKALAERDVQPDLIIGTSVGALNGVFVASRLGSAGVDKLAEVWRGLRRKHVFPISPVSGALGYYGRQNWLVRPTPLEALVRKHTTFARLEDAPVPLHVVATDIRSGMEVLLSRGDTVSAVLASAAIPGIFPPVMSEGRELVDGGVANNTPLSHALALGATTVYVLPAGYACALPEPPKSALGTAIQALTILIGRGLAQDIERHDSSYALQVMPPLCPLDVTPTDFSRADELIERAYRSSLAWLDAPKLPARHPRYPQTLAPHNH